MRVDGIEVARVLEPRSVDELAEIVRTERGPVAPVGRGTKLSFGNPLQPVDAVVDLSRLDRVTEYNPADLTIHFEAGVRLGHLERLLAEKNQMLPLDPWCGPEATLGGIVAANAQGPLRAVGTVRDWVIGMRVIDARGVLSRTGGRVVKNVSGYDLAKLYTGSLGTLGIVAELSLKLRARYDATASARLRVEDAEAASGIVQAMRGGPWDPVSFLWTGPDHTIWVRFGEQRSAVDWQLEQLPGGDWEIVRDEAEEDFWRSARDLYNALPEPVVRVATLPGRVAELIRRFRPSAWLIHAANGIVLMAVAPEQIAELRQECPVIVERASRELRSNVGTFGLEGAGYQIMKDLKRALDPDGRLNPGRHVDGEGGA